MFRNYFKIALRNIKKHKLSSFINLFGLTIGLTCCLLIVVYIINEISYDKYNKNADNVYRVERTFLNPETGTVNLQLSTVAPPFGLYLENDFKEIKQITRLLNNGVTVFHYEDKMFNEQNGYFADEHLFNVFDVDVTKGNPAKALSEPYSVMLSEPIAKKYFGNEEPLNKMVKLDNIMPCKVTGVYKPFPGNAHLHPSLLISFSTLKDSVVYGEKNLRTNWGNNSFFTYLLLPHAYNPKRLEAQFPAFQDRHIDDGPHARFKPSQYSQLTLRKLGDIHLHSHTDLEAEVNGDINRIYIFSAIALFILLIACINYMNLSTARSVVRAKEIGIRKVVGAVRSELIAQFLCESALISMIAAVLALICTWAALPWLNVLSGQELSVSLLMNWQVVVAIVVVPLIVGSFSGIYPALFLSSFKPIKVLKGVFKADGGSISLRKVLVVAQFAISIVLIIATATVFQQLKYMQDKSLGFDREHVVTMQYNPSLNETFRSFRTELMEDPLIKDVARSSRIPSGRLLDASGSQLNRGDSFAPTNADIKVVTADEDFFNAYKIKIAAGRNFYQAQVDTNAFVINEAAVKVLGLRSNEEAIGKQFRYGGREGELVGVVKDFHFESLHQRIIPLVFLMSKSAGGYGTISVKLSGQNIPLAVSHIEKTWKKFLPEVPFSYTFLDDNFQKLYEAEQRQGKVFTVFACIAIVLGCLGLLGLSAFAVSQRIKEVGIRKVLGASLGSIVSLLSRDFLKLVGIAAVIAFPVAWYTMNSWLQDFAYRINIPIWLFIVAGLIATAIAFVTISSQAIKAALSNPVNTLRNE